MAKLRSWLIKVGPSKYKWMEALFHRKRGGDTVEMTIQTAAGEETEVREICIYAVGKSEKDDHRDRDDPQGWYFIGLMGARSTRPGYCPETPSLPVRGEYSTSSREGKLEELSESEWNLLRKFGL